MSSASLRCLEDHEVAALVEGEAEAEIVRRAHEHGASCERCRGMLAVVGRLRAQDEESGPEPSTVPSRPQPARFEAGARLRRYEIVAELGRGGMGVVFEAYDPKLDRAVAIKVMHHDDEEQLARISREAQAVARLSHPNVVQIFDAGLTDARAFIVMALIEGRTLSEWVAERSHRWRDIVRVHEAAGRGLAAAHAAGLVHRDFKPANVLVGKRGYVTVLDFGLARPTGEALTTAFNGPATALTLTATGVAVGTPAYMAPEQHRGEKVTEKADIYAFGAALYRSLYGELPFAGHTVEALFLAKQREQLRKPADSSVPEPVHAAICRALAYDPGQRWDSMRELVAALHRTRTKRRSGAIAFVGAAAVAAGIFAASELVAPRQTDDRPLSASLGRVIDETHARGLIDEGRALLHADVYDAALARFEEGGSLAETVGADATRLDGAIGLIDAYAALERTDDALEAAKLARALADRADADPGRRMSLLSAEGMALPKVRRPERIALLEQAVAIGRGHPGEHEQALATALTYLANAVADTARDRGRTLATEALALRRRLSGPDDRATLDVEIVVAQLTNDYKECAELGSSVYGRATSPLIRARAARTVAVCFADLGDPKGGIVWVDRALEEVAATYSEDFAAIRREARVQGLVALARWRSPRRGGSQSAGGRAARGAFSPPESAGRDGLRQPQHQPGSPRRVRPRRGVRPPSDRGGSSPG